MYRVMKRTQTAIGVKDIMTRAIFQPLVSETTMPDNTMFNDMMKEDRFDPMAPCNYFV